jgi:hypothetical protein
VGVSRSVIAMGRLVDCAEGVDGSFNSIVECKSSSDVDEVTGTRSLIDIGPTDVRLHRLCRCDKRLSTHCGARLMQGKS